MDTELFWKMIESSRAQNQKAQEAKLQESLFAMHPNDVAYFSQIYFEYFKKLNLRKLWGAGILMNGGWCSDDCFEYFRNWIISKGQEIYQAALEDPNTLIKVSSELISEHPSAVFEEFGYIASEVYSKQTGKWLEHNHRIPEDSMPTKDFSEYSDEQLATDLPDLWEKYGSFKKAFDLDDAAFESQLPPKLSSVKVVGFGKISLGDILVHETFGQGVVKEIDQIGDIVNVLITFADQSRWIFVEKNCSYLSQNKLSMRL